MSTHSVDQTPVIPAWRGVRLLRPYGRWLGLVVVLLCLLTVTDMALPWFLKLLVDDVFVPASSGGGRWELLWFILPGIGLVYVSRNTLFFLSRMRALRISEDLCFELRKQIFEHLQQLSMRFYRSHQPGRLSARLMDDTFKIQTFIQDKLPTLVRYLLEFQVLLVIIYLVNWRLALASTIVLPLHFWVYRRYGRSIRVSHREAQQHLEVAHGNVVEQFLGMEVVKGFTAEERESTSFREAIDASRRSTIRSHRFHVLQKVAADLVVGVGMVLLLGYGGWEVSRGRMTGGGFLMFFWYMKMLYPAVLEVISGTGHLSRASASAERIFEMLDEPGSETSRRGLDIEPDDIAGAIRFENVSFAYEESGPDAVHELDFSIAAGEHVAIIGPSGSGKSTLISLLPRFNDPTRGRVLLDGRPLEEFSIHALRGLYGIVFQDLFLFDASIGENLRYARPEATPEEIIEACRMTGAHEFIERLPDGYDTLIGSSGVELSRGEKQRITIARALVRDPRILILDEATASLDVAAAREIMRTILNNASGRTVIMVTHDTELLDLVDRVVSIERGRVVAQGSPTTMDLPINNAALPVPEAPPSLHLRRDDAEEVVDPVETKERLHDPEDADGADDPPRPFRPSAGGALPLLIGTLAAACFAGTMASCVSSEHSSREFGVDTPRVGAGGLLIEEHDPVDLNRLAAALDALSVDPTDIRLTADQRAAQAAMTARNEVGPSLEEVAALLEDDRIPPEAVGLKVLPRVNATEIMELVTGVRLRLAANHGYTDATTFLANRLPDPPEGTTSIGVLARAADGRTSAIRFAYREFASQPPVLWYSALDVAADGSITASEDLALVVPALDAMIGTLVEMRGSLTSAELGAELIQLSYADAEHAVQMLKGMGVTTFNTPAEVPASVEFAQLPYVVRMPDPSGEDTTLIGAPESRSGTFGVSLTPSVASKLNANTLTSPMTQLLVMYHPAHPEQFSHARRLVDEYIDRPARQILVEGMVLEISEDGLEDLGIDWEMAAGPISLRTGSLEAGGLSDTLDLESSDLDFWRVFNRNLDFDFSVEIRALVRDGKAEVLSRPSVLTLNNRQSTIRVGRDIPIATSQEIGNASSKISFSFQYLPTGILLNIRPRINEDGSEVSMLIDTIVSGTVPGADLEVRNSDGDLLASAPTVDTRRVQTYARIRNNTPFIIGGLVAREQTTTLDKVPILGDLPLIGGAFRAERSESTKREVIIVLTPYVLPEEQLVGRTLPKDEDLFDSFGDRLFRDSYRIRGNDIFDLGFLRENHRLRTYRELADEVITANFELAEIEPFRSFAGNSVPGEQVLVTRMIYEVIKRRKVGQDVALSKMILVSKENVGGFEVNTLQEVLCDAAESASPADFFKKRRDKALAITFTIDPESMRPGTLEREQIPRLMIVDCPPRDEEAWSDLLWDLNQPDSSGRLRHTILIKSERDLLRLRRAMALKRIVQLNGGRSQLTLQNFSVGKMLLMPELKPEQGHIVDPQVAQYFFQTEHYYGATLQQIEDRLIELDVALRRPEIRMLLEDDAALGE